MIKLLVRSRTLRSLLELFCLHPQERLYLREIERRTGEPVGALQPQLSRLTADKLLLREKEGPLCYYRLNKEYPYLKELQSIIQREARREKLEKNLKTLLRRLKRDYQPDKVILFGSMARGNVNQSSDLDMIIIKKNVPKRYWDRVKELSPVLSHCNVGVDYTVWTPKEFSHEVKTNDFLKSEVMKHGKVLYERAH